MLVHIYNQEYASIYIRVHIVCIVTHEGRGGGGEGRLRNVTCLLFVIKTNPLRTSNEDLLYCGNYLTSKIELFNLGI
jgi:hypothetical protein